MKPEEQRIAIAEFCGFAKWKAKSGNVYLCLVSQTQGDYFRSCGDRITTDEITQPLTGVPDYLNDLNAMQSAVLSQKGDFKNSFQFQLNSIAKERGKLFCELTAEDWADAFMLSF